MMESDTDNIASPTPKKGIGIRVVNIDGCSRLPRRGALKQVNGNPENKIPNVLDGLLKISSPVNNEPVQIDVENDGRFDTENLDPQIPKVHVMNDSRVNEVANEVLQPKLTYAEKLKNTDPIRRQVNFRLLDNMDVVKDADVVIPRESVRQVQSKFSNVLYGYFLDSRLPFPVVEYYAKNVWGKYGFSKLMLNSNGFFFFKFDSKEGMMNVLEGGPWLIRNTPIFLNTWSPTATLRKDDVKKVAIWVRMHNVPLAVYSDDGLSLLASKIGTPIRLDKYTADMCVDNWGRNSYARAMIEINADKELKEHVVVAIPNLEDDGYVMEKIRIEYEWRPSRCDLCCVFGHDGAKCPKIQPKQAEVPKVDEDGFQMVKSKTKGKFVVHQKKPKPKFVYKPKVVKDKPSTSGVIKDDYKVPLDLKKDVQVPHVKPKPASNRFSTLAVEDSDDGFDQMQSEISNYMVMDDRADNKISEGASTPGVDSLNG